MKRLLIFLKYPAPGRVKTRLAAALGEQAACDIYRQCAELTLEQMRAVRAETTLCVDPPEALARTRAWLGDSWMLWPQRGTTLGERLADATQQAFADGAQRVVVIGTDSPWLQPSDIDAAFDALARTDVALGPTEDGGYYLIGLSRPLPALFEGIRWGTSSVYEETLDRARAAHLQVTALPRGYDIDRIEDLQRFTRERRQPCLS